MKDLVIERVKHIGDARIDECLVQLRSLRFSARFGI
jgi:tRNA nucleotidyltransferase/poly(A) polymerase